MADDKKMGYKSGDVAKGTDIDLDKYTFKNSDVVKWTEYKPKKREAIKQSAPSGLASLANRSRFRKR